MTVHRKTYRPYTGALTASTKLFWVIARRELRIGLRKPWVRRLLVLAGIPMLFFMAFLYVELVINRVGGPDILGITLFENFYSGQTFFVVLMMAAVGADIIAKDAVSGAHHLYFSRPLTRGQYMVGKLLAVGLVLALVVVVPGLLLALAQLLLAPEQDYAEFGRLSLGLISYGAVLSATGAALIAVLSAFGRRARYVGIVWVSLYFFSSVAAGALTQVTGGADWSRLVSIQAMFRDSGLFFYGEDSPGAWPLILLVMLGLLSVALLYWRIGALERREG